jgi:hypothetical protein
MARNITIICEPSDGNPDKVTGIHVDNGDGTAKWITGSDLDTTTPPGSPHNWRYIGDRFKTDAKTLPTYVVPELHSAPTIPPTQ